MDGASPPASLANGPGYPLRHHLLRRLQRLRSGRSQYGPVFGASTNGTLTTLVCFDHSQGSQNNRAEKPTVVLVFGELWLDNYMRMNCSIDENAIVAAVPMDRDCGLWRRLAASLRMAHRDGAWTSSRGRLHHEGRLFVGTKPNRSFKKHLILAHNQ